MRVGIIGSGNRAALYINALRALREDFEIASMFFRSQEKADLFQRRHGVPATISMDEFKGARPDFVVNVVNYHELCKVSMNLIDDGIPVLSETPAAASMQELSELWRMYVDRKAKILVAENYFEEPCYAAMIGAAERGYLGDVQTVTISSTHDYHAASLIRVLLGALDEPFSAIGKKMDLELAATQNMDGSLVRDGGAQTAERYHIIMNFPNNKTGFYDFAIAQYWSAIRSRYMMVQGSRGEIKDDCIWYIAGNGSPARAGFQSNRDSDGRLVSISVGGDVVYENELHPRGVDGCLISICHMLLNMKRYLETGAAKYPFENAMQDAYITQVFQECGRRPLELIRSEKMPWNR